MINRMCLIITDGPLVQFNRKADLALPDTGIIVMACTAVGTGQTKEEQVKK